MVVAASEADGQTYRLPCGWQDADGNLYSAASWEASEEWIAAAQAPLTRPVWDTDEIIDMEAAERAQARLVFSLEPVAANPTQLVSIGGLSGPDALIAMGLTSIPQSENV